ncbi:MAG: prepilin-type N-terminal cleavage/methylation domain-containing protein [Candidatus Riflebacteria bacterium]|nr:prepilin-type N-terminal cleavage/methylation domain-containing protein [Candidatus Riflebacteria bacterium]
MRRWLSPSPGRGVTLVEMLVVIFVFSLLLAAVYRIFFNALWGTRRGFDSLSVLQEESQFLAVLKHDLRTLIMGTNAGIPPPTLDTDSAGNSTAGFFMVQAIDTTGRPVVTPVQYRCLPAGKRAFAGKAPVDVFTLERRAGSGADQKVRLFMRGLVVAFQLDWLDAAQNILPPNDPTRVHKVRVTLKTQAGEILQVMVSLYSPYLVGVASDVPQAAWLNNYMIVPFQPGRRVVTFDLVTLEPEEYETLPGARGLAIFGEL